MALTPDEILGIQRDSEALLDLTCTISRPQPGSGAWGQTTEASFTLIAVNVACMVAEPQSTLLLAQGGGQVIAERDLYTIQVPVPARGGPNVQENDQCVVTERDGTQTTLRVQSVASPHSYELLREFTATIVA